MRYHGVDDDVVAIRHLERSAEPFTRRPLMLIAGDQIDASTGGRRSDRCAKPDRTATDDADPVLGRDPSSAHSVDGDGEGLDQRGIAWLDAGREPNDRRLAHQAGLRHPAIAADPVDHAEPSDAEVVVATQTSGTSPARRQRLNRHRGAVGQPAGELMPERCHEPEPEEMQVGRTDACARNADHDTIPRGRRHLSCGCSTVVNTYRSHRRSITTSTDATRRFSDMATALPIIPADAPQCRLSPSLPPRLELARLIRTRPPEMRAGRAAVILAKCAPGSCVRRVLVSRWRAST